MQTNLANRSLSLFGDEWSNGWFEVMSTIMGDYECKEYSPENQNDWHFVTISSTDDSPWVLEWENRAEVHWELT